jgi:Skp family chaperone for outer membrane proteins
MKLAAMLFFSFLTFAQQSATTSAPCSPIAPENTGTITINCPGMSKEQGQKMLAILNKIQANQLDPDVVMTKLDEIRSGVSSIKSELEIKKEQEQEADRKRRTAPIMAVSLDVVTPKTVKVCIKSQNAIPYMFRYLIVDSKNVVLGGFALEMQTVYPSNDDPHCETKDIDLVSIRDHYLALRITFKSLSFDELRLPGHAGQDEFRYTVSDDGTSVHPLPHLPATQY